MQLTRPQTFWIGIEAGGTKFVCVAACNPHEELRREVFPTRAPDETLSAVNQFIQDCTAAFGAPVAIGVAAFGPVNIDPGSPRYGCVLRTPKRGWEGVNYIADLCVSGSEVIVDTDVNAAALAEAHWSTFPIANTLAYVTVGTGIGVGLSKNGKSLNGTTHYEFGHLRPKRVEGDDFDGICPYHGDCFEGLASGPAVIARYGETLSDLGNQHPAFSLEAHYLGQLCTAIFFSHAPARIFLGGGVMSTPGLLAAVQAETKTLCGGYGAWQNPHQQISAPSLGSRSGVLGALYLAGMR